MPEQILAQYSVRAKQSYVYKTNKALEITGASENIKNAFDWLLSAAAEADVTVLPLPALTQPFSVQQTQADFAAGKVQGVVLFEGGGNLTVLYASWAAYQTATMAFTYACHCKAPGMTPLCVPCAVDFAADDYKGDYARLMEQANRQKNIMTLGQSFAHAPFSLIDRTTSAPITHKRDYTLCTAEANAKRNASKALIASVGQSDHTLAQGALQTKLLDELVTQKGKESLLAVIYADGNAMGIKVQKALANCNGYEASVNKMREFSVEIDAVFVKDGYAAVLDVLAKLQRTQLGLSAADPLPEDPRYTCRAIIGGGDEITFICNAQLALPVAEAYLRSLPAGYSSCAGICLFHNKYPFASAYQLAEACCENAKQKPHAVQDPAKAEQCWLDWYYLHSGNGELDELRERQGVADCIARPWQVSEEENEEQITALRRLDKAFRAAEVARTNIKTLGAAYEQSKTLFDGELARVYSRHAGLQRALTDIFPQERLGKAIYDYAECFDLWFGKRSAATEV